MHFTDWGALIVAPSQGWGQIRSLHEEKAHAADEASGDRQKDGYDQPDDRSRKLRDHNPLLFESRNTGATHLLARSARL